MAHVAHTDALRAPTKRQAMHAQDKKEQQQQQQQNLMRISRKPKHRQRVIMRGTEKSTIQTFYTIQ